MNGTDTWVIVLAAFGGGLVGAVVQPLLSYFMQRLRQGEEVRKERERSLRRMLVAELRHGRRLQGVAFTVFSLRGAGHTDIDYESVLKEISPEGLPFWEPYRIQDRQLRDMAITHNETMAEVYDFCIGTAVDAGRMKELAKQLDDLQRQIMARMDGFNWPEADD